MIINPWRDNTHSIITKSIEPIEKKYLHIIGETSIKNLPLPKAEQLFHLVINNFKKGILSSDEIASFGFRIFHGIAKHYPKSDLFLASLYASELSYYLRTKEGFYNLPKLLREIEIFHEKEGKT